MSNNQISLLTTNVDKISFSTTNVDINENIINSNSEEINKLDIISKNYGKNNANLMQLPINNSYENNNINKTNLLNNILLPNIEFENIK